jgi:hypothetical protein
MKLLHIEVIPVQLCYHENIILSERTTTDIFGNNILG